MPESGFTVLYLAAGLSSRFGGKIKCLQEVGRHGETLLELSVRQIQKHGAKDIVIVVSDATESLIRELVGVEFLGLPVRYCTQDKPNWRKKPLGTVHALLAAESAIDGPFVVLNGDTLYGDKALASVGAHLKSSTSGAGTAAHCMPGYKLKDVLPEQGRVNRAVVNIEPSTGRLQDIVEQYNIAKIDIPVHYSGNELTSMNIFGFQRSVLNFARVKFDSWLETLDRSEENTSEFILSTMLNDLYNETGEMTIVYPLDASVPLELTNPEDFAYVRNNLALVGL